MAKKPAGQYTDLTHLTLDEAIEQIFEDYDCSHEFMLSVANRSD